MALLWPAFRKEGFTVRSKEQESEEGRPPQQAWEMSTSGKTEGPAAGGRRAVAEDRREPLPAGS